LISRGFSSGLQSAAEDLSPAVKHLVQRYNINASTIKGTGRRGKILKGDVLQYLENPKSSQIQQNFSQQPGLPKQPPVSIPPSSSTAKTQQLPKVNYEDIPNSNIRKVTAKRLTESKSTIPHSYLSMEIAIDNLLEVRKTLNGSQSVKISVNDFILRACALSLKDVPEANAFWDPKDDKSPIKLHKSVDLSVAVATERGLFTPIVKNADLKGLAAIATEVKELSTKAQNNKLLPHEFQGGTFSISNLGMFDIDLFSAVINPPQAAILAVGKGKKVVAVNEATNQPMVSNHMVVTLSRDARVIDEDVAAKFLVAVKKYLENPYHMMGVGLNKK